MLLFFRGRKKINNKHCIIASAPRSPPTSLVRETITSSSIVMIRDCDTEKAISSIRSFSFCADRPTSSPTQFRCNSSIKITAPSSEYGVRWAEGVGDRGKRPWLGKIASETQYGPDLMTSSPSGRVSGSVAAYHFGSGGPPVDNTRVGFVSG
jgi:hypothetical protein